MYQIIWTPLAKDTYAETLKYLMEFSLDAAIKLDDKVEKITELLETNKHLCPKSLSLPRFRKCVATKSTSLVYEVVDNTVRIMAIIDNRTDHLF